MYFGYSLNKGMLKALQSLPFLLILSCFIQITTYDFIQFRCSKHWNPNAVTIRLPLHSKASPANTNTDNLQFLLHANPSNAASISAWFQACIYMLLLSELGGGVKEKGKKNQRGHYVTTSIFQDAVLRKSSWVHISAGTASWNCCLTQEEELQKAHTTGSQALQRALEAGKYQTTTYSKPNNNSGSFCHLLTLAMYLQPTQGVNTDNKPV